jgi:hypothetical protein
LTACGGGSSPPTPNADPQGFWQGTAGDGRDVSTLILEQGQYFMVFSSGTTVSGMVEGAFSVSGNTLIDNAAIDFPASGGRHYCERYGFRHDTTVAIPHRC